MGHTSRLCQDAGVDGDRLTALAPSPGAVVDKKYSIWSHPTSLPPDPMLRDMVRPLDEDFSRLTLIPVLKAPRVKKDFPIHTFEVADQVDARG